MSEFLLGFKANYLEKMRGYLTSLHTNQEADEASDYLWFL